MDYILTMLCMGTIFAEVVCLGVWVKLALNNMDAKLDYWKWAGIIAIWPIYCSIKLIQGIIRGIAECI